MFYEYQITVPANTPQYDPVVSRLKIEPGIIEYAEIQFPVGTRCTVHVQVSYHGHQIWPTNRDGNITSDGYVVPLNDPVEIDEPEFELVFTGWSTADTYDYDINVRLTVWRLDQIEQQSGLFTSLKKFLAKVGFGS